MIQRTMRNISKEQYWLFVILLASFIIKIIYVFYFTDYKNYVVNDMAGYWHRAIDRYNGNFYSLTQYISYATFFHFYLTFIFKLLASLGLFDYKLEVIIFFNIVYSVVATFFFYFIASHILKNTLFSLIVTCFYAFTYPLIYFNSFILSENLSNPLVVISLYLILFHSRSKTTLFFGGLLLGVAVAARPVLGFLGLPFFLYILFANSPSKYSWLKSICFAIGFFLVIVLVIRENSCISDGKLKNLAGNGGLSFFTRQCTPAVVKSIYQGYHLHIGSVLPPTRSEYVTDHPMYDQKYFYKLGLDCIKENPSILLTNLKDYKMVFFGPFFPMYGPSWGFDFFIKISNYLIFFMTLSLGLLPSLFKIKSNLYKEMLLLISIPFLMLFMMYFFVVDLRYLTPGYFAIYILSLSVILNMKKYKKDVFVYSVVLILGFLLYWLWG